MSYLAGSTCLSSSNAKSISTPTTSVEFEQRTRNGSLAARVDYRRLLFHAVAEVTRLAIRNQSASRAPMVRRRFAASVPLSTITCSVVMIDRLRKQASKPTFFSTVLRYSAATGGATLGELAEWDAEFVAPFAAGAFISARGLSERRDFPSK